MWNNFGCSPFQARIFLALVSVFILSDNFFDSQPIFGSIGFPDPELYAESFEKKKKIIKKSNVQEACQTLKVIGLAISSHTISFQFLDTSG